MEGATNGRMSSPFLVNYDASLFPRGDRISVTGVGIEFNVCVIEEFTLTVAVEAESDLGVRCEVSGSRTLECPNTTGCCR